MFRYAAPFVFVFVVVGVSLTPRSVAGQYLSVEPTSLASNLGSTGLQLNAFGQASAGRSGAVVDRLPSNYMADLADRDPAEDAAARAADLYAGDRVRENWLVVAMLGLGFGIGLTITLSMVRRATVVQAPTPLF